MEQIIAAILAAGTLKERDAPKQAVEVFKQTLDQLRQSGGIPPRRG
jgi:hypothetical protein